MRKSLLYFSILIIVTNFLFFAVGILANIGFVGAFMGGLMAIGTDPIIIVISILIGTVLVNLQSRFLVIYFILASIIGATIVHLMLGTTKLIVDIVRVDVLLIIPSIIIIVASLFGPKSKVSTKKNKVKVNPYYDNNRPTTNKNTFISSGYRLLKVDTLDNTPISEETIEKIGKQIKKNNSDIVIFSDFRHGIFHRNSTEKFCNYISKKTFKIADSQVASRWGNITEFKNFDLITPNEKEARFSLADQDSTVGGLAGRLKTKTNYKNIILKLGSRGIVCCSGKVPEIYSIGSFADNVLDAVGSGDALLAYSSLILKTTNSIVAAGIIGSIAAACECEIDGNKPINVDLVLQKIDSIEKKTQYN